MVKAFLAHKKQKANGNTSSHVQLRKYHDVILWGSQQAKQLLPRAYYDDIEKFLTSYRKETEVDAKKRQTQFLGPSSSSF
jgi:ATP-dependent protease Clp ATPase subunit